MADEPTGNLDSDTAAVVLDLLCSLSDRGTTVIVATHERDLAGVDRARRAGGRSRDPMTTAYRRKILRDLWRERTRTALVVLAIALGIAAFSGVLSAYAILTRELNRGYLATNPASATLFVDRLDDALVRALAEQPGVGEVEGRRSLRGRIKAGPGEWRNLQLFVVRTTRTSASAGSRRSRAPGRPRRARCWSSATRSRS